MGLPHTAFGRIGILLAASLVALWAGTAAAQTTLKVAIDGNITGPLAPLFVAQDRGDYRAKKLDVRIDRTVPGPDALSRVDAGLADVAIADLNAFVKFRDSKPGTPMKAVFMIYNKPPYAVIARSSRGIAKPKDLEGKRLGAPAADFASTLWPLLAKINEIDRTKVKLENVALAVREPMLAAGQVDAVIGGSLTTYIDVEERGVPVNDLTILLMGDYGVQLYGDAIIVNTKFAAQNPEALKAFLAAYTKALQTTIDDPARAIAAITKRNEEAKPDTELKRLHMAVNNDIVTDEVLENGLGNVDSARLAAAIDQLAEVTNLQAKPAPADIFDPSFLPPPSQRKIGRRPGKAEESPKFRRFPG
ncbi:MAG TPA: ABC transporter substrate-binding protein [Xanthobacteraceae bacterium]|nr:ABC transporter substrate-binding protein [Xanthobacteraceae bacterium]